MADTTKPDYSKIIHGQAMEISHEILDLLSANKETFVPDMLEADPEKIRKQEEDNADFGHKIVLLLATKQIPSDYATLAIDKIVQNLAGLKAFIDGTINSHHDEFMSRSYGKRNWEGKFRREEVTVGDVILKLDEIRKATGDKRADYFNDAMPEMNADGQILSPFTGEKLADDSESVV